MKNKNKNTKLFLFLFLIPLLAGFFGFSANPAQAGSSLAISSVEVKGKEIIKLFNSTEDPINTKGFYLSYYSASKDWNDPYRNWEFPDQTISSKGTFFISVYSPAEEESGQSIDWQIKSSSGSPYTTGQLSDSAGSIAIFSWDPKKKTADENEMERLDVFSWGKVDFVKENEETLPVSEQTVYSDKIFINEFLPAPSPGKEEFIEFYNPTTEQIVLSDWKLTDASASGKYIFPKGTFVEPSEFFSVYKNNFKFALNNSGSESINLFDPNGKLVSSVSYSGSKTDVSYNYDGENWKESRFLTPGQKNKLNNPPKVKGEKTKKIYVNMYAEFSAKGYDADKDKLKFTWDFGDGHKSYLQKTHHKYEKSGKYEVILKVSDGSEDVFQNFDIEVKKFPKSKVTIVNILPNPKGKDSGLEYITLKNETKKKLNLKDWIIATDTKNLYNHKINGNLVLKPGQTIQVTRKISAFSLNNKKAKIELRYPDGKTASKVSYDKKTEAVAEDEIYTKESGQWAWVAPKTETSLAIAEKSNPIAVSPQVEEKPIILAASGKNFSEDKNLRKIVLENLANQPGKVLGSYVYKSSFSDKQNMPTYSEIIFTKLNSAINFFLNYFFLKLGVENARLVL